MLIFGQYKHCAMTEKLWQTIAIRNSIMTIAEEIAPIFKSQTMEMFGFKARYISVKNVEFEAENLGFCQQYNTEIEFLSDQGSWFKNVIVRYFNSEEEVERELNLFQILELNCLKFANTNPTPLITANKQERYVVFDLLNDKKFEDLNLTVKYQDFLLGTLYSIIHGGKSYELDIYEILELVKYGINDFMTNRERKVDLLKKVDGYKNLISATKYGYLTSTLPNPKIFRFRYLISEESLSERDISYQNAFEVTILPNQSQEKYSDRMLDIGLLFADDGFKEFKTTANIKQTKARILHFLRAYRIIHKKISKVTMEEIYPLGYPLDLYMILVVYLSGVNQLNEMKDAKNKETLVLELLNYFDFILTTHPFQMYGDTILN